MRSLLLSTALLLCITPATVTAQDWGKVGESYDFGENGMTIDATTDSKKKSPKDKVKRPEKVQPKPKSVATPKGGK